MNKLDFVRQTLKDGEYTCVVSVGDEVFTSRERGVKPLLDFLSSGLSFKGAFAADKTIGAGAAYLYVLLGVDSLWANVISESALEILKSNNINVFYEQLVPYIINRKGDGVCPIETAVENAKSSEEAYQLIVETLAKIQKAK